MGEGGGEDAISGSGWWVKPRKGGANGRDATNPGPLPAPSTCLGLIDRRSPQQQNWLETRTRKTESSEFPRHPIGTSPVVIRHPRRCALCFCRGRAAVSGARSPERSQSKVTGPRRFAFFHRTLSVASAGGSEHRSAAARMVEWRGACAARRLHATHTAR